MNTAPLTLIDFTVLRSGSPLFQPLSLSLSPGESCEIWGQNGVGKTSFLESLAMLHKDFQGQITLPSVASYLSTKAPYDDSKTIEQNLLFWKKLWKTPDILFENACDFWQIHSFLKLPYTTLSDGQKQRVNLARLFLKKSSLWLLDEPTRHLDPQGCLLVTKALKSHLQQGGPPS